MLSNLLNNVRTIKSRVIDQHSATTRRVKELYNEGGVSEVSRGIRDYYEHNVSNTTYQDGRTDNEHRWSIIESHIQPDFQMLVDLGCADGFFVGKAAENGMRAHGIEGNYNRVERTQKQFASNNKVTIEQEFLSPDNIEKVPASDIILFLTVHHHWVWQYGWEQAADMFRVVADRGEIVCYEPPGNKAIRSGKKKMNPAESIEYYEAIITEIFGDSVTVLSKELVDYTGGARSDPLFVLDTSEFRM